MNDTFDSPELEPNEAVDGSVDHEPQPASEATPTESRSFALLAIALLIFVGGAVYFVGSVLAANEETAAAEASANEQIELFDPTEFADEFGTDTPSSLPLGDDPSPAEDSADEDVVSDDDVEPTPTTEQPDTSAQNDGPAMPAVDPADIALAFINRVPGDEYGLVGYVDPAGERHLTELECSRLDLNEHVGICLSATAGLGGSGRGFLLDPGLNPTLRFGVNLPSRAAVSPDGAVVAWTGFSLGHSYLNPGEFATTTQLISVERSIGANLETVFTTYRDDEIVTDVDANYWGVTFVDSDRFYATLGTGEGTSIVEGRVSNSRLDVVVENATCPEVSPDGRTLVAKERRGDFMQVVAIDVETGERRDLPETRSVEDQVEFADEDTILYALPNPDEGTEAQPVFDIWALDLTPGAEPRMILPFADSPAA